MKNLRPAVLAAAFSFWLAGLVPMAASAQAGGAAAAQAPVEIAISCGAVGIELELCREGTQQWAEQTGHRVRLVSTPNASNERLALYQQLLSARSDQIDVLQIDVVWPALLAQHLVDLRPHSQGAERAHFPAIVANNTVGGALVAMPWFTDAGVLFYRKDLLDKHGAEVPATWQALTETAQRIQTAERAAGNERLWGFVWQGRAYEGLTCNALEWVHGLGGGTLVNDSGEVTTGHPALAEALTLAASWVGTISPPGVLNYDEEASRGVFQSGQAVFMRNWPYAWALAQSEDSPVRGKVGVAALPGAPGGAERTGTLGGWQLAVSRHSRHPEVAASLVMHLTSQVEQKRRAIAGAYNPTLPALYEDVDVLAATPFFGDLKDTFEHAVARPSRATGAQYNRVSAEFWGAVHSTLSGQSSAAQSQQRLTRNLQRLQRRGW